MKKEITERTGSYLPCWEPWERFQVAFFWTVYEHAHLFSFIYIAIGLWAPHTPTMTLGFPNMYFQVFTLFMTFLDVYSTPHMS